MGSWFGRWLKRGAVLIASAALTLLAVRAWDASQGPPLMPWHTKVPDDLVADAIDGTDWPGYLAHEDRLFAEVERRVVQPPPRGQAMPVERYIAGSPVHPSRLPADWNRSSLLRPEGVPTGAVVLLHGLTDSPYSLRHIARRYQARGFVAVTIRLPGHGTVPAGLTAADGDDWLAATRLAVRTAVAAAGPGVPLHLVGYSNGGALAVLHALAALDDPALARPDQLVLLSPMIGVTAFARFAGAAGLPAIFPAFAKAAWLSILPEFNPFKYNSFPVFAARQSWLLSDRLQRAVARQARDGRLGALPPVLTVQSVVDFTVSTPAVVAALYRFLPANGSALVLIDRNRESKLGAFLRPGEALTPDGLLAPPPRPYRTVVLTNADTGTDQVVARTVEAGETRTTVTATGLAYPREVFSLSHVALPFPIDDPLYGLEAAGNDTYGIEIGRLVGRGERGALVVGLDFFLRMPSNPFFPDLLARIDQAIDASIGATGAAGGR
jgi:alpha-beta hydrolase superfamily lysophospholipase